MVGKGQVAVFASIVKAATVHLDRNNVSRAVIMLATGLRIEIYAMHVRQSEDHRVS